MTLNESTEKNNNQILLGGRAKNIVQKNLDPNMFPFDGFEFDDPNRVKRPALRMKAPWDIQIGGAPLPWDQETSGIIPTNGWYATFFDLNETTLKSVSSDLEIEPSLIRLRNAAYGVSGEVKFDLNDIPNYSGEYTVVFWKDRSWNYITSGGINNSNYATVTGDELRIWSGFTFTLSLTMSYVTPSFREVLVIPQNYNQVDIENILNNATTFMNYFPDDGSAPSLTLSSKGLLWTSGDRYIRLGETASFHSVDLDSGDFETGVQGWQIKANGDAEFNDGTFRGTLVIGSSGKEVEERVSEVEVTANGKSTVFYQDSEPSDHTAGNIWVDTNDNNAMYIANGTGYANAYSLKSDNFSSGSNGWAIYKDGDVEFNNGIFRGNLDAASGTFAGDVEIGADDANRQLSLGSKGLLVKDANDNTIHDIADVLLSGSTVNLGHFYHIAVDTSLYSFLNYNVTTTSANYNGHATRSYSLSDLGLNDLEGSNIKGLRFYIVMHGYASPVKYKAQDNVTNYDYMLLNFRSLYYLDSTTFKYGEALGSESNNVNHFSFVGEINTPLSYDNKVHLSGSVALSGFSTSSGTLHGYINIRPIGFWV